MLKIKVCVITALCLLFATELFSFDCEEHWLANVFSSPSLSKVNPNQPRKYEIPVSVEERKDISYILKTLAYKSYPELIKHKASLEYAGNRIDHVHPLRFLMCALSEETMKTSLHAIRDRGGWVWRDFKKGLIESLDEETRLQNMRDDQINHFASELRIDPQLIYASIKGTRWEELIDILLTALPRKGDPKRYDM
jgi:hypothetical protein